MPRYTAKDAIGRQCKVYLNGEPVQKAVEADDDLGFVVIFDKNAPTGQRLLTGRVAVSFGDTAPTAADDHPHTGRPPKTLGP